MFLLRKKNEEEEEKKKKAKKKGGKKLEFSSLEHLCFQKDKFLYRNLSK